MTTRRTTLILSLFAACSLLIPRVSYPCSLASQFLTIPRDGDVLVATNGKILFAFSPSIRLNFKPRLAVGEQEIAGKITGEIKETLYEETLDGYLTSYATFETDEPLRPDTLYTFELVLEDPTDWIFSKPPKIQFVTAGFLDDSPPEFQKIEIQKIATREGEGSSVCDYEGVHNDVTLSFSGLKDQSEGHYIFYKLFLTKEGNEEIDLQNPFRIIEGNKLSKVDSNIQTLNFSFQEVGANNYHLTLLAEDIYGHQSALWSTVFTSVSKDTQPTENIVNLELTTAESNQPASSATCSLNESQILSLDSCVPWVFLFFFLIVTRAYLRRDPHLPYI